MLPWQKKRKEEAELAAKKEMESTTTGVIDDKDTNEKIIESATTEKEKQATQPEIELDSQEVGLINNHRASLQIQLHNIQLLEEILKKAKQFKFLNTLFLLLSPAKLFVEKVKTVNRKRQEESLKMKHDNVEGED